jgi:hypothetical protein
MMAKKRTAKSEGPELTEDQYYELFRPKRMGTDQIDRDQKEMIKRGFFIKKLATDLVDSLKAEKTSANALKNLIDYLQTDNKELAGALEHEIKQRYIQAALIKAYG